MQTQIHLLTYLLGLCDILLQVCSAGSRLLIQESVYDDVIARIKQRMSTLRLGHCLDKTIDMGAIVDESQRRSIDEMVQSARADGVEVCLNHYRLPTCP